mmetsp:Transcript_1263/g.1498  ORF Transcript_1263/g.1498 Transcript_1263/m.1498 type:complete len:88 (-) Transcript_1263:3321-3584(-)
MIREDVGVLEQPDTDYLETMKLRMKGLPTQSSASFNSLKKNFASKNTQDLIDSAMEAMLSPNHSQTSGGSNEAIHALLMETSKAAKG